MMLRKKSEGIEMFFSLLLLLVFGICTFLLVINGSIAYEKSVVSQSQISDIRIASNYLYNHLHRKDDDNAIRFLRDVSGVGNVLVIDDINQTEELETWIYIQDQRLCEAYISKDTTFDPRMGFEICKLSAMNLELLGDSLIKIELVSELDEKRILLCEVRNEKRRE